MTCQAQSVELAPLLKFQCLENVTRALCGGGGQDQQGAEVS